MQLLYSSPTKVFQEIVAAHPLWQHEFFNRCRHSQLTLAEVQVLAVQMYKFCQSFNRILASVFAACPEEDVQLVILDNLSDEMGGGDPTQTHPELFRHFTRQLGIDDLTLAALPTAPETQVLIDTYLSLAKNYGYVAAIATICFASEGIVSSLYKQLRQGIVGVMSFPPESLVFFDVHLNMDDQHAANLESILENRINQKEIGKIKAAILVAMNARIQFFDGIQYAAGINHYNICYTSKA